MTVFPLKNVFSKPDLSGQLAKWAVKHSEYGVLFEPRTSIKSQVLADFITDFSVDQMLVAEKELFEISNNTLECWTLFIDGSNNFNKSGVGIVLNAPNGDRVEQAIRCGFKVTNNEAEYEALVASLKSAAELKIKNLTVKSDS